MRGGVDAARHAADDGPAATRQLLRERTRVILATFGRAARPYHRHGRLQQEARVSAHEEQDGRVSGVEKGGWVARIGQRDEVMPRLGQELDCGQHSGVYFGFGRCGKSGRDLAWNVACERGRRGREYVLRQAQLLEQVTGCGTAQPRFSHQP